jgi:predicted dithiol-disulfide oxidoreductase (DUF899 family)
MSTDDNRAIDDHPVVSHEEWLAARRALLEREKAFTRQADNLSAAQRELPWETVTNFDYQASFTPEEMAAKLALYTFTMREPKAREPEGHSIFYRNHDGAVFHTYPCYDRGNDKLNLHYHYLDLVPKGRDEGRRRPYWVRRRGEYDRSLERTGRSPEPSAPSHGPR